MCFFCAPLGGLSLSVSLSLSLTQSVSAGMLAIFAAEEAALLMKSLKGQCLFKDLNRACIVYLFKDTEDTCS